MAELREVVAQAHLSRSGRWAVDGSGPHLLTASAAPVAGKAHIGSSTARNACGSGCEHCEL